MKSYTVPAPGPPAVVGVIDDGESPVSILLRAGNITVPLQNISVVVTVRNCIAEVEILQRFVNAESNPLEVTFAFQQEDVTVYEFYAEIGDKKVVGVCHEKEKAFHKYDDSISRGHGAYLLEKQGDDLFQLNVGNLPPAAECIISIKYSTILITEGDALKLIVPISKVPIYNSIPSERFPTAFSLTADIQMPRPIIGVESETHEIQFELNEGGSTATLSLKAEQPSRREFSLLIGVLDLHKEPSAVVEVHDHPTLSSSAEQSTSVMISYFPGTQNLFESHDEVIMEYIFLVDRSGSMSGSKNSQLRNALQLFLRSIPVGSLFNIVGFGSTYQSLFPSSVVYDDSSLEMASKHAAGLKANLGGTNILPPLSDILSKPTHKKFPRQIFILTDGEVNDTEQVITTAKKNCAMTRIFTLGIGAEASKRLVKGLAKAGKGHAEFVVSGDRMESKVLAQLKRAMQPHTDVTVDWGSLAEDVTQSPSAIPPVFPGDPIVIFGLLARPLTPADDHVTLSLSLPNGDTRSLPVFLTCAAITGSMVGVLAASASISETERKFENNLIEEHVAKTIIVPLALKYSLATRFTSLVAQEARDEPTEGAMEARKVGEPQSSPLTLPPPPSLIDDGYAHQHAIASPRDQSSRLRDAQRIAAETEEIGHQVLADLQRQSEVLERSRNSVGDTNSSIGGKIIDSIGSSLGSIKESASSSLSKLWPPPLFASRAYSRYTASDELQRNSEGNRYISNVLDDDAKLADALDKHEKKSQSASSFGFLSNIFSSPRNNNNASSTEANQYYSAAPEDGSSAFSSPYSSPPLSPNSSFSSLAREDPNKRPLDRFIMLQLASGSWKLSEAFLNIIGITRVQIEAEYGPIGDENGWLAGVLATSLAVAFLEVRFSANYDEWSLLKDKALRWMTKELQRNNSVETVETMITKAKKVLS